MHDFLTEHIADVMKQLADPDAEERTIPYLRGALGALLLVKAKLDADADEPKTEATT